MKQILILNLILQITYASDQFELETIKKSCVDFSKIKTKPSVSDCNVSSFGNLGSVDGKDYFYSIYCILTGEKSKCGDNSWGANYNKNRGVAVFIGEPGASSVSLVEAKASSENNLYYKVPEIIDTEYGKILSFPIVMDGSGAFDYSEYYFFRDKKWNKIESESWKESVLKKIPQGLSISKGFRADFKTMSAHIYLAKEGDGNCCPTGGEAEVKFEILKDQLSIKDIKITPNQKVEEK